MKNINIHVWDSDLEEGKVPNFFAKAWGLKMNEDPYDNKRRCDHASNVTGCLLFYGAGFIMLALLLEVLFGVFISLPYILFVVAIGIVFLGIVVYRKDPPSHFWEFCSSVQKLFQTFNISPSKEIGAMSWEEFVTAIAGSLRTAAKEVDDKHGFERVAAMNEWKEMHAEALKWELCKPGYENYFPKKN